MRLSLCYLLATFFGLVALSEAEIAIELDLTNQRAYLIQDGDIVYDSPISSGRATHPTPTGSFVVTEKDVDHRSSLYGRVVDAAGRVVKADADSDTPVPRGGKFVKAPMRYFLRFDGAVGMHAGILPGYPASHGCVRLPSSKAALFYNIAEVGTPIRVYGKPPYRSPRKRVAPKVVPREYPEEVESLPPPEHYEERRGRRVPFFFRFF